VGTKVEIHFRGCKRLERRKL